MCIDLSKSGLPYDMEYILENLGNHYFSQTAAQMNGITEDDFVSSYRMTSSVVSKGKYQRYGSVQKSDGMATQFGYTETYAVLNENKLIFAYFSAFALAERLLLSSKYKSMYLLTRCRILFSSERVGFLKSKTDTL